MTGCYTGVMATAFPRLLALLLMCALGCAVALANDPPALEKTLARHGVKTDTASLLAFFRGRTLTDADHDRMRQLVRQLGADKYAARVSAEKALIEAGHKALRHLTPALKDDDPEIVRRVRTCLKAIDPTPESDQILAAAGLLVLRLADAAGVLLDFLPHLEEPGIEDDLLRHLHTLHGLGGKNAAAVHAGLSSKQAKVRAAAAYAVGRSSYKEERDRAVALLRDDDALVRLRTAEALIVARDVRGIVGLLGLIEAGPLDQASRAEALLGILAGDRAPSLLLSEDAGERKQCHLAWRRWWAEHGPRLDLAKVDLSQAIQGVRLVVANSGYGGGGAVWEYAADRKPRWTLRDVGGPFDARVLPGGRLLLAEYDAKRVTERDRAGKILWQYTPPNPPLEVQRLSGDRTLITTNHQILEVTRDGRADVLVRNEPDGNLFTGQRLANGHLLYGLYTGWLIELDRLGKEVLRLRIERPYGLANVVVLPDGRFLIPQARSGRIVEMDRTGKVTREVEVAKPTTVAVLPGGNLLVGSHELNTVREIDAKGKLLWEHKADGQVFRVRVR